MRKVTVSRMRERYAQTVPTFRITYILHKYNNFNQNLHYWHHNKSIFIVNYLLMYVLNDFWRKLFADGDNVEKYTT